MAKANLKGFDKFINKELKGAKKKEAIRQEKRKYKAEKREAGRLAHKKKMEKLNGTYQPPIKKSSNNTNKVEKIILEKDVAEIMPLNKFIAHAGICGRREAVELIKESMISVNGTIVTEPGFKVSDKDLVKYKGKKISAKTTAVYILLNKPKDYITTSDDPKGRKTVLDLIKGATPERVYPVGRLDRNTTGVLLLTNDGDLAQKLTHPSYEIKKIYEVTLDKEFSKKDFDKVLNGLNLEDGFIKADALSFLEDKKSLGIEIHSGRNRIVRRIFESLGYTVEKLDRVLFANLTKKNVNRGKWRMLNEKEVRLLKYMNKSFVKKVKPVASSELLVASGKK
ncbi:MAG: rRNA pseudouridine synthase [Chitinophagaceae bacterium]|nr:rRNA pseudouridine synthase [Chitinophagaceae bacterium]